MDGWPKRRNKAAFSNFSGFKSVFEKLCFRDGLVWTVGLTVEIKLRFQIALVFEKLRLRDGLVWTVGLTVEIKLCFQRNVDGAKKDHGACYAKTSPVS